MVTRITPLPPPPQRSDPENFAPRGDTFMTALPPFADEVNQAAEEIDEAVDTAQAAASASLSNAGFVGRWEDQTGPATPPYSAFHGGLFWSLLDSIADVTASEPDPYNTQWAVTGAPAWYNNFAVGDYLDTARSPGAGWLRRNGATYPKSTYPELAPLMPSIPASFVFNEAADFGLGESASLNEIIQFGEVLVAYQKKSSGTPSIDNATQHVYFSLDDGETWSSKQVFSSARPLFSCGVFGGILLIGTDNGQYLKFSDIDTFTLETVPGLTGSVGIACSPTAVIAVGFLSPSTVYIRRSTDLSSWSTVSVPAGQTALTFAGYTGDLFVAWGPPSVGVIYSADNGQSFTYKARPSVAATPDFGSLANSGLVLVDGDLVIPTERSQASGNNRTAALVFVASPTSTTAYEDPSLGAGWSSTFFSKLGPLYLWGLAGFPASKSDRMGYSFDKSSWTYQDIPWKVPSGSIQERASIVAGDWLIICGRGGQIFRTRYLETDSFRVPDDNPTSGWIKAVSDSAGTVGYAGVPEAPLDGEDHVRNNGAWKRLSGGGGMTYPSAGIPVSTGTEWGTSKAAPTGAIVGTSDTQTLTSKTMGTGTRESVATGSAISITDTSAPIHKVTLAGNVVATVSLAEGVSRTLNINPGAFTVTWPSTIDWMGGSAPSLPASKWSRLEFSGSPISGRVDGALVLSRP